MGMKRSVGRIKKSIALVAAAVVMALSAAPATQALAAGPTTINATTFRGNTEISTIHIGSDVTEITSGAFRGLMRLRSITVSKNNPFFTSYSNCLYNKDMTELICFPAALTGAMIPESVVSIRENALYGVGDSLKDQIRSVIYAQASEGLMESEVPGEHFIHTDKGVKWRNSDGTYKDPDTDIMKLTARLVETCTTGNMTQRTQLQECFDYFVNAAVYERKIDVPLGDWTRDYAVDILQNGKGNCYNYAAAFAYIARGLGYESRVCTGTVASSKGGRTAHAWTEVKLGNDWYIFDTEMQDAKKSGYYKQTYDSYPAGPLQKDGSWTVYY